MNRPKCSHRCQCCGKPLSDPISIEMGIGPVCRIGQKTAEAADRNGSLFGDRADYSYSLIDGVACIIDNDRGRTVTNDADNVIADLVADGLPLSTLRVIYRDTRGVWDELAVEHGRFAGFRSINERDRRAAITKCLSNSNH